MRVRVLGVPFIGSEHALVVVSTAWGLGPDLLSDSAAIWLLGFYFQSASIDGEREGALRPRVQESESSLV